MASSTKLLYLKQIDVRNSIQKLKKNINEKVTTHLDDNQLQSVPPGSLKSLRRLQKLWLNGNQLKEIPSQALSQLPELEALDLGENKIQSVPDYAFRNLTKLVILGIYALTRLILIAAKLVAIHYHFDGLLLVNGQILKICIKQPRKKKMEDSHRFPSN
ncbi:hypothetical protein CEXT_83351 [Caerostris extrusa]|uniref:Uncharacterized protein n=1 Tax=Caerostris extrusa TaxID=172846 RepID=A0AAV4X995_CAEEX|nr:hypothetical protein CEXT_83351 [Caerostris extrusa]